MEEELISKKDLLEQTNISYGQLYRWKRKGLIPEKWFIRKSTFTGQETFFPREQVLTRISKIKSMKDDISLDDLADVFSPSADAVLLGADEIAQYGIATEDVTRLYMEGMSKKKLGFDELQMLYIFNRVLMSGDVSLDEGRVMLDVLRTNAAKYGDEPSALYLTRKVGVFGCFSISPPSDVCLDKDTRLVSKIELSAVKEELKLKLMQEE